MEKDFTTFIVISVLGSIYFLFHLFNMILSLPSARDRKTRFEYIGKVIPGIPGLLIIGVICSSNMPIRITFGILTALTLVFGRPLYELIVFSGFEIKDEEKR